MSGSVHVAFGDWLRQRRREAGITQDELAERLACSSITLRKIEGGERQPSRQIALLIAELFNLPVDEHEAFVTFSRSGPDRQRDVQQLSDSANAAAPLAPYQASLPPAHIQYDMQAPWRTSHLLRGNLPRALTSFIGREREKEVLRNLLAQRNVRLLTLVGAPGIGKTRLCLEVVAHPEIEEHFDSGVFFVELASISDPTLVLPTIAATLGLREAGGQAESLDARLLQYLQDKRLLLVLDNFEQVLDAAPRIVELLTRSPWLKVLVTSREPLHVRGERRFNVPPLELPLLTKTFDFEALSGNQAVALFVERTHDLLSDFMLTEGNAEHVASICIGLDGLPLAIELAAARANTVSPEELHAALGDSLRILTEGARDLPARHRTLRAAIEWSYALLGEKEQKLYRRLGVFAGGFTREAADTVCNRSGDIGEVAVDILEGLASLADKSLLVEDRSGSGLRFSMLETLREYAVEQLKVNGEEELLRQSHALYLLTLAQEADVNLHRPGQPELLDRLELERANFRAALQWLLEQHDSEAACQLSAALWYYWWLRDHMNEGIEWLRRSVELDGDNVKIANNANSVTRAQALSRLGALAALAGDSVTARNALEESVSIYHDKSRDQQMSDVRGMGFALNTLAITLIAQGDQSGLPMLEESVTICRQEGDKFTLAWTLDGRARLGWYIGDYEKAAVDLEESLSLCRKIGDTFGMAAMLLNLGLVRYMQAYHELSLECLRESIALFRELKMQHGVATSIETLAGLASAMGEPERAGRLFGAGNALLKAIGAVSPPVYQPSYKQSLANAHAQLDETIWQQAWAEGQAMTLVQAIDYALENKT